MLTLLWVAIIGSIIGGIAGTIVGRKGSGCLTNIFAGVVGSYVGHFIFGVRGPTIAGMAVFPSIVGAVIVVGAISLIFDRRK